MKRHYIPGVRIAGVACAVPKGIEGPGKHERAAKMVGVEQRRFVAEGDSLLGLAVHASVRCMEIVDWAAADALIFVTQTAPRRMPSVSCELHDALAFPPGTPAFDLNMACSGYVYGLWVAASLRLRRVLLVVGDTISQFLDHGDASTYPIFGDAVSATALEQTGENFGIDFVGGTDGSGAESLCITRRYHDQAEVLRMDGQAVFNFALSTVPELVAETTLNGFCNWYLFHQANAMMIQHIAKKAGLDSARVPMNIAKYGNTSSASLPLLMCDSECTEALRTGKNVLALFGFGAGYSMGGIRTVTDRLPCSVVQV